MKKGIVYLILFFICGSVTAFVILVNKQKEESILPMKERIGILSQSDEYKTYRQVQTQ